MAVNAEGFGERAFVFKVAENGYQRVVRLLLKNETNINEKGHETMALGWMAKYGDEAVVWLLPKNRDAGGFGGTALMSAARNGSEAMLRLLVEEGKGADINAKNNRVVKGDGKTVLQLVVEDGRAATLRLLLEHGADMNAKWDGKTMLQLAVKIRHEAMVRVLLDNGADINAKGDWDRKTALQLAVEGGQVRLRSFHILLYNLSMFPLITLTDLSARSTMSFPL